MELLRLMSICEAEMYIHSASCHVTHQNHPNESSDIVIKCKWTELPGV